MSPITNAFPHGGPDALGVPRHDFSTNSNACGPCPQVLAAVQQADACSYPDPGYTALREQLADFHRVSPGRVLLAASGSEFIQRISAWAARRSGQVAGVWLPEHHYGDYARAAQAWGLQPVDDPAKAGLLWCCEPSSPLGQAQPGLAALADHLAPQQTAVLDCAYAPLRLSGAPSLGADGLNRVWQLWTPNKALGLTGIRAAYVIARPDAAEAVAALEALCPSWPLGAHGVALLQAWCGADAQAWLAATLDVLRGWKQRQQALCGALGWTVLPSDTNFFCAKPAVPDLPALLALLAHLRGQGIKLRDATSFGLPGWVRLGVLPPQAQQALEVTCASN